MDNGKLAVFLGTQVKRAQSGELLDRQIEGYALLEMAVDETVDQMSDTGYTRHDAAS